jgi:PAS domain S-box-containing protein
VKPQPISSEALDAAATLAAGDSVLQTDYTPSPGVRQFGFRLVALVGVVVFGVEISVMIYLARIDVIAAFQVGVWDAVLVAGLTAPVVYFALARPLIRQMTALAHAEAQHRLQIAALEAAAHGVVITDRTGRIRYTNPALSQMTGYTREELAGQTPRLLNSGRHDAAFFRALWERILAGHVWTGEVINRRKDGTLYYEEQSITPVRGAQGDITHFVAIKHDVTGRKQDAEQLAQRNRELLELSRAEHQQRQLAEALAAATTAINSSLELNRVLDLILEQAQELAPCRMTGVLLLRGDWVEVTRVRCRTDAAPLEDHSPIPGFSLVHFPCLQTTRDTQMVKVCCDTTESSGCPRLAGLEWVQSLLAAPLIDAGQVIGFLMGFSDQPHHFGAEAVRGLSALAGQATAALQNARLFAAELRARRTAESLTEASVALTQTLELTTIGVTLLAYLRRLTPYSGAYVALYDNETQFLVHAVDGYRGTLTAPIPVGERLDPTECPWLDAALQRQTITASDALQDGSDPLCPLASTTRSYVVAPLVAANRAVGLCVLEHTAPAGFGRDQCVLIEALAAQAAVAAHNALLYQQVRESHARLQSLSHRLVNVQESERREIARELHDEAGQALTSLIVGLRRLERDLAGAADGYSQAAGELATLAHDVWENLHRLAVDLRPASLDHLGLVQALTAYIERVSQQARLRVAFKTVALGQERLPQEVETALYRIAQEALTNVTRHAHATHADVLLQRNGDRVTLIVEDNGCGFEPAEHAGVDSIGLLGMRERCEMLGGVFRLESAPGRGTTLVGEIPCGNSNSGR